MMSFTYEGTTLEPFGLYFRQIISVQPQMAQTTSEPEITTGDGNDPDKIDSIWIPDEDEDRTIFQEAKRINILKHH